MGNSMCLGSEKNKEGRGGGWGLHQRSLRRSPRLCVRAWDAIKGRTHVTLEYSPQDISPDSPGEMKYLMPK